MAINAVVESLDTIPEQYRDLYTAQGDKFVLTGVEGVKPLEEFTRVHGGLTKERNDHKTTKTQLAAWLALGTAEEVQGKLDRIAELEAAAGGSLDDAAITKLVETRIGTRLAPIEREKQGLLAQLAEKDTLLGAYAAKERTRNIHDTLREVLKKHEGFQPSAFDDAAMLAERVMEVDDEGHVTAKDGMGCTPGIDLAVWLTEMQSKRPHWWGPSAGGGAKGGGGGQGGTNPWSADGWNMTEQARVYRENAGRADQLARSAGTTIGGPRPVKK